MEGGDLKKREEGEGRDRDGGEGGGGRKERARTREVMKIDKGREVKRGKE